MLRRSTTAIASATSFLPLKQLHQSAIPRQNPVKSKTEMGKSKDTLIYLLRHDLRVADNPIFHSLVSKDKHSFAHVLPLYIFNKQQIDLSGFVPSGKESENPYPAPLSEVGKFPRCGPHRVKFLTETVWDLKEELRKVGSDLCIRVGSTEDVMRELIGKLKASAQNLTVWMVGEEGTEESDEEQTVRDVCIDKDVEFKLWNDEKYFIDE